MMPRPHHEACAHKLGPIRRATSTPLSRVKGRSGLRTGGKKGGQEGLGAPGVGEQVTKIPSWGNRGAVEAGTAPRLQTSIVH